MAGIFEKKYASDPSEVTKGEENISINDFSFGSMIAKGCCGAVYEAKYKMREGGFFIQFDGLLSHVSILVSSCIHIQK